MYDIIKTRAYYGEIKAGTLLRSTGDGSKLIRVREITGPETCTVESYGRVTYGNIKFTSKLYVRTGHIHRYTMEWGKNKGRHEALVEVQTHRNSWHKEWGYVPVEIYSKMVSVQDAYEMGTRSAKRALSCPMSWGRNDLALTRRGFLSAQQYGLSRMPWPQIPELCAAWCHGFMSLPLPNAAEWLAARDARITKRNKNLV
jgi:hypothetical protein